MAQAYLILPSEVRLGHPRERMSFPRRTQKQILNSPVTLDDSMHTLDLRSILAGHDRTALGCLIRRCR